MLVWILLHAKAPPLLSQNETTEISLIEIPQTKGRFTADADLSVPNVVKELHDQADMLSNLTRRVKERLQARQLGTTRNAQNQPIRRGDREGIAGMKLRGSDKDGFLRPGDEGDMRNTSVGPAMIDALIPGVEFGAINALNSDQFTYYAFFRRLNEQLRNRWTAQLSNYMSGLNLYDAQMLSLVDRSTMIEVIVTPEGELADTIIYRSSGVKALDDITANSFRLAAPYNNPPQGLVAKDDKHIHLFYNFTVVFRPPTFDPGGR